jgi:hypothetical protein
VADGSGLSYIVDELIGLSAVQVVIPDGGYVASFVDRLAVPLKNRVKVVSERRARDATEGVCGRIAEEFGFKIESQGRAVRGQNIDSEAGAAFSTLYFSLPKFRLGMEYQLQVDIPLDALLQATQVIRNSSKSEHTRAVMAAFQGVFAAYRPTEQAGLVVTSNALETFQNCSNV